MAKEVEAATNSISSLGLMFQASWPYIPGCILVIAQVVGFPDSVDDQIDHSIYFSVSHQYPLNKSANVLSKDLEAYREF